MSNEFQEFINKCWSNHDSKSLEVAEDLEKNLHLIDTTDKIPGYVSIVVHTFGGHLGKWNEASSLLSKIEELPSFENNQAVYRGQASLAYCMDNKENFSKYSGLCTDEGSLVRIYAVAASELTGQGEIEKATLAFEKANSEAPDGINSSNPAAKALAVSGNNLACELEEKESRNESEIALMLSAAKTARKYWEIAGTWVEVERAEYRLAISHLKAEKFNEALMHARICESICIENNADPFELFFAYEALTKVNRAICVDLKSKVKEEYQGYCQIP
ncbi:MAG: hypothetical protein CME70_09100 [Halobacteriovorax sp.]|nr:hypothetical protein [Halobacteriovorax sp.]|tara:strand:+ start:25765 stop:26589 length:825 start_codon:yes stop_codon:yes gene_type:complete